VSAFPCPGEVVVIIIRNALNAASGRGPSGCKGTTLRMEERMLSRIGAISPWRWSETFGKRSARRSRATASIYNELDAEYVTR